MIYLRASPETCHRRIMKRQRSEEAAIPLGYLAGLHQQHERWLVKHETGYGPVSERETPVLILDADQASDPAAATDPALLVRVAATDTSATAPPRLLASI